MKHSILCVDDEINNVEALERLFRKKYNVFKATSADEGLGILKKNAVSLIISDQRMPHKTGVEFLKESREFAPKAVRILLTGYTDIESAIDAINSGEVYRYISKPWDPVDLANTVDKAIERVELASELEIKNKELEKALIELRSLDEAKDQFMILINHELKTPLTAIISFMELLKESSPTNEQNKYILRVLQGVERLERIVNDSMQFISAETGKLEINLKKINIQNVLQKSVDKFQSLAEKRKQKIINTKSDLTIKGDAQIIEAVVDRLLENALKHGQEDSKIQISVKPTAGGVRLEVKNQGRAISKKIIANLHRPFNLDKDMLKHSEGLGLGLSLSQALLKRHQSELQIACESGEVSVSFEISE